MILFNVKAQRGEAAIKGARLCAKHQPQPPASNALPEIPGDSLLAKRCGWSFRDNRAPENPRAMRGFGWIAVKRSQ